MSDGAPRRDARERARGVERGGGGDAARRRADEQAGRARALSETPAAERWPCIFTMSSIIANARVMPAKVSRNEKSPSEKNA